MARPFRQVALIAAARRRLGIMNKWIILAGCILSAVLLGLYAWQKIDEEAYAAEARDHASAAAQVREAERDALAAGLLVRQYVTSGDASDLPEMRSLMDSSLSQLETGVVASGNRPDDLMEQGTAIAASTDAVIVSRQAGDLRDATSRLDSVTGEFFGFIAAQEKFAASEEAKASAARASAEDAENLGQLFGLASAVLILATAAMATLTIGRRIRRRTSITAAVTPTEA
jgi:hypothetical protein